MKNKISTGNGAYYLKISILIFILVLIPGLYFVNSYTFFLIMQTETGEIIFRRAVKMEETITLNYYHSVTKQSVDEIFSVKDRKTLELKEMRYDSFGPNLPVGPEQLESENTEFIVEDGFYKIIYNDRKFDAVPLRVGQVVADHTFIFEDNENLRLLDVAEGGSSVEFYVQPLLSIF